MQKNKDMNNPLYKFEIKAFHCLIELYINDIIVFCHYEDNGSVWVDWPINQYILKSGVQNFEIKIIPYKGKDILCEKTQLEIGIHAINNTEDERVEIIEKNEIKIPNKDKLPMYVYKGIFNVEVPYQNIGWENSLDLTKSDKKSLLYEILEWNNKLLNIYKTSDLTEYNRVYRKREEEFAASYYSSYEENTLDVFHSKFKELTSLPNDLYHLEFYANGKIASVKIPNEMPGFTYIPSIISQDSLGISLILFFHRKEEGKALEIIR